MKINILERIFALMLLILLSPFLFMLFIIVITTSKGGFVFKQKRIGLNRRAFYIYKIRTMEPNAEREQKKLLKMNEANGPVFKIKNDPRFTPVGKFISKHGLDEILQVVNIVKGEMSFVGPRPFPSNEAVKIPGKYRLRFSVLPGITSLWVVEGAYHSSFKKWMESDIKHIKNKSTITDLKILLKTVLIFIKSFNTL